MLYMEKLQKWRFRLPFSGGGVNQGTGNQPVVTTSNWNVSLSAHFRTVPCPNLRPKLGVDTSTENPVCTIAEPKLPEDAPVPLPHRVK